ncbi:hypothetical protein [Anaeropeptidivorans aminofermentans]|uniref:hypothetical protein n=1 Tax=Anaeropeptidivorans aminofermentans TaxID=2934315 RepID=UPI0020250B7F|nr:hypothetical protein [Anaeropeptidivorans aminofermentans]
MVPLALEAPVVPEDPAALEALEDPVDPEGLYHQSVLVVLGGLEYNNNSLHCSNSSRGKHYIDYIYSS